MKLLNENKNISFVDRLQNPQNYGAMYQGKHIPKEGLLNFFKDVPEAEINTHLMSAEFDEQGNAYMFPLIQKGENGLIQFSETREGKRNALNKKKKNNNAILFNSFVSILPFVNATCGYITLIATPQVSLHFILSFYK